MLNRVSRMHGQLSVIYEATEFLIIYYCLLVNAGCSVHDNPFWCHCEVRSVIRFLCAKGSSAVKIHWKLCLVDWPIVMGMEKLENGVEVLKMATQMCMMKGGAARSIFRSTTSKNMWPKNCKMINDCWLVWLENYRILDAPLLPQEYSYSTKNKDCAVY